MLLVSSNPTKLDEYARLGLDLQLQLGEDLPEVHGTAEEVALHKAKMAGCGCVVEDTIVVVDNTPWVDIKWTKDGLDLPALELWANELSEFGFALPVLLDEWDTRCSKKGLEKAVDGQGFRGLGGRFDNIRWPYLFIHYFFMWRKHL